MRGNAVRCSRCSGKRTPGRVVTAVLKPSSLAIANSRGPAEVVRFVNLIYRSFLPEIEALQDAFTCHDLLRSFVATAPMPEFDDFFALDLRVGRVTEVAPFPEARQPAWKLTVDFGPHVGVLQTSAKVTNYTREQLLGRQVVGAVNLGSKRIAGFKSEFLILGGLEADGTVRLLEIDGDLPPGSVVA